MSLESFKPFADKLPEAMLLLSSRGDILSINRAASRLLRLSVDELAGTNINLITGLSQAEIVDHLKPCSRSRIPVQVALKFNTPSNAGGSFIQSTAFLFTPATDTTPAHILLRLQKTKSSSNQFVALKQDIEKQNKTLRLLSQSRETLRANEEKLATILSSIGNGVITTDVDGMVIFVNPAALKMLSYDPGEMVGQDIHQLIYRPQVDGVHSSVEESPVYQAYRGGNASQVDDEVFQRKDGSCFSVEYMVRPVVKGKQVSGSVIVFSDITGRKAMEDELKHHDFLSDQALGLTRSGYWHVPLDGTGYYNSSKRAVGIFGDVPNEHFRYRIAEDWFVNVQAGDLEASKRTWENFKDAAAGAIPAFDSIYAYKRPVDGRVVWIHAFGTVARDREGKATDMYGVTQDITEYIHAEQALRRAKEAADAASRAKSEFLANMSHELRTPMNAILGYSEMLMEEAEDAGQDDFIPDLKKINQAGSHLLSLINDVLDISKVESGKMEAFAEEFDVGSLIDQASGTAQPLMAKNNNRFKIERGEMLGKAVQDVRKLSQSLFNTLSNAAKFTEDGAVTLRAERETRADGEWLSFLVSDTGIGIPNDKLEHVFEEFRQADNSTTREYGGTGLGLAISRRYCRMLGGDLTVTSQPGVGSSFTIRVPVAFPGTEALEPTVDVDNQSAGLDRVEPGNTILVIDDDAEACDIIRRSLEKAHWQVTEAGDGREALDQLARRKPRLVLLDLMMPVMDGFDFLHEMRANPEWRDIPVLVLTAKDLTEEDRRVLSGRVEQVVEKAAYSQQQVMALIRTIVARVEVEKAAPG